MRRNPATSTHGSSIATTGIIRLSYCARQFLLQTQKRPALQGILE